VATDRQEGDAADAAHCMGPQALRMNLNTFLRQDVFSVEQLSSTVSEAGTNFTSDKRLGQSFYNDKRLGQSFYNDKRLGQSFYNRVDYVADRIADESEIRRGNSSSISTLLRT
jgi:hypothetical protein